MSPPATARLAAASPAFLSRTPPPAIEDWLAYFDPDAVLCTEPAPRAMNTLRRLCPADTVLFAPEGRTAGRQEIAGVPFVFAPTVDALQQFSPPETDRTTYICSDLLGLTVDKTTLSSSLTGKDAYRDALDPEIIEGDHIHLSTALPAEYRKEWDNLSVVGGGAEAGMADTPLVALDCRADGTVLTRTLKPSRLGLQALDQVGPRRADRLREAGFRSRGQIADADQARIADLSGIGGNTARRIKQSAEAIASGEIVRTGDEPLPSGDPVYIDIETDGLSPTITWLIGVLDTSDDSYHSFLQPDPDEPGGAIAAFLEWYTTNASGRPIVAYNGWGFDFEVIHEHIVEYCPTYEDDWTSSYRFDPYQWATDGNAILPGRTNKLEDVAAALGYERDETQLTGGALARRYREWMTAPEELNLDWERYESYCEDDVRALAVIYDALKDSSRLVSSNTDSSNQQTASRQGTLSEW